MTGDEEVGLVDAGVAAPAEIGRVGGAVERRFATAELANPSFLLHLAKTLKQGRERNPKTALRKKRADLEKRRWFWGVGGKRERE